MIPSVRQRVTRLLLAYLLLPVVALAQPSGPAQPIILEHADNLTGSQTPSGELIEASGDVRLKQGQVDIRADRAVLHSDQNRASLYGNVVIRQPGSILRAPEIQYDGRSKIATAPQGVTVEEGDAVLRAARGEYFIPRRVSVFAGGVELKDEDGILTALGGTYNSIERRADFRGNVVARTDSGTMMSDELTYWRDSEESFARGGVLLTYDAERTRLTGDTVRRYPARDYAVATGSPRLRKIDSTLRAIDEGAVVPDSVMLDVVEVDGLLYQIERDTLTIVARRLEQFGGENQRLIAQGRVHMTRGDLEATAEIIRYVESEGIVALGSAGMADPSELRSDRAVTGGLVADTLQAPSMEPAPDTLDTPENPPADSLVGSEENLVGDGISGDTTLVAGLDAWPGPVVWYQNSQMTGDTMTVFLEEKKVREIEVLGNAFAASATGSSDRYDQLAAVNLTFTIRDDSLRLVEADGQAASVYFLFDNETPDGVNRSSSDTLTVQFVQGKAERIAYYGPRSGVEGEVIPERSIGGDPSRYRLEGFALYEKPTGGVIGLTSSESQPGPTDSENTTVPEGNGTSPSNDADEELERDDEPAGETDDNSTPDDG